MSPKKIFLLAAALVIAVQISTGTINSVSADNDSQAISIQSTLFVTAIEGFETNPKNGWSTIERETLQAVAPSAVVEGPSELNGLVLSAVQSSREKFSSPDITVATVSKGKSKGTFYMSDLTGGVQVIGEYKLKLSHSDECQILGQGKWKVDDESRSIIEGKGKINVCTNWVQLSPNPADATFVTTVSVTGRASLADVGDDDDDEDEDDDDD